MIGQLFNAISDTVSMVCFTDLCTFRVEIRATRTHGHANHFLAGACMFCLKVILGAMVLISPSDAATVLRTQQSDEVDLLVNTSQSTDVTYTLEISGTILTPSADGDRQFPLKSSGEFRFRNHPALSDVAGAQGLKAVRNFDRASTETTVGTDHTTKVLLPSLYRTMHVFGGDQGLQHVSPRYPLQRKFVDLLQMSFDVLPSTALLPTASVNVGDKWNADAWVVPLLTGIDAVIEQSVTCHLKSVSDGVATVAFEGKVDGAVQGSAAKATFSGEFQVDLAAGLIRSLNAIQQEQRTPGPVSPGLNVTAKTSWVQDVAEQEATDETLAEEPTAQQLQLYLQTPQKLQVRHSREWHLFHETPGVIMMRQIRHGNLVSQCNIAAAVTVPPRQHTPDQEFLSDVNTAVKERKGTVLNESTVRDDDQWRIRHVQAVGDADGKVIVWDYYLCTAVSGEQYSIVFSHAKQDAAEFEGEAERVLSTLQVARPRPALPFRRSSE